MANYYSVPPFSGAHFQENSARCGPFDPCAICGKPLKRGPTAYAVVIEGGTAWGDEHSDPNDPGYMGSFGIGPDCHKKYLVRGKCPDCGTAGALA